MNKKNTAIYLIDDMARNIPYPYTQWDSDMRGAKNTEKWPYRVIDSAVDTYPTVLRRPVTEQFDGKVTLECEVELVSGNGFFLGFYSRDDKSDDIDAFRITHRNNAFYAGDKKVFDVKENFNYFKITLDIDTRIAKVSNNGITIGEFEFTGPSKSISGFKCGFDKEDIGCAKLAHTVKMYKNYLVNDFCVYHKEKPLSDDYIISTTGESTTGMKSYGKPMFAGGIPEQVNYICGKKGSKTTLSQKFDKATGVVCLETKYLFINEGATLSVSLNSNYTNAVTVSDKYTEIFTKDGALRSHSEHVWQTLRIEADTATKTALVRLNGKKVSVVPFDITADYIDSISFSLDCEMDTEVYFSDVMAFIIPPLPADYVPEPIVPEKKSNHIVGMNICSLWRTGQHYGWDTITPYHEPLLGYYDEGIAETADWEIKWMCENGIDFQLYCWYGKCGDRPTKWTPQSAAIHQGHMLAKYSDKVKLALLWEAACSHNPTLEDFKKYLMPYFVDYFFSDDRYMVIDNKPVVAVYGPSCLVRDLGSTAAVKEMFDYMRSEIKKLGFDDMILLACDSYDKVAKECGFDGGYAYFWGIQGYSAEYTKQQIQKKMELKDGIYVVPTVSTGYNSVAWQDKRYPKMTPSDFEDVLTWFRDDLLPRNEKGSWQSRLAMISNWNEYGEGTFIAPAKEFGFGYLEAVRRVFLKDVPHVNIAPTESQKERLGYLHRKDRKLLAAKHLIKYDNNNLGLVKKYTFNTEDDLKYFEPHNIDSLKIENGKLVGKVLENNDPYFIIRDDSLLPLRSDRVSKIVINTKAYKPVNSMCCNTISFSNRPDNALVDKGRMTEFTDPTKVAALTFDTASNRFWTGNINFLRFDPLWGKGDFEIESIEIFASPEHIYFSRDNVPMISFSYSDTNENGLIFVPFDVRSGIVNINNNMYYEWHHTDSQLVIWTDKKYIITVGSDKVECDGKTITIDGPVYMKDGLPMLPINLFAQMINCDIEKIDDFNINFVSRK